MANGNGVDGRRRDGRGAERGWARAKDVEIYNSTAVGS